MKSTKGDHRMAQKKSTAGTIATILGASIGMIAGWMMKLITGFKRR